MSTEPMRDAFEVWLDEPHPLDGKMIRRHYFDSKSLAVAKMAWQAATLVERERAAKVCEALGMSSNGIYQRNHDCAVEIRKGGAS